MNTTITRHQLEIDRRVSHTAALFGVHFPMQLEPYVYSVTSELANEYHGGYWQFYTLSNGAFYMAPVSDRNFRVRCPNAYEGTLSPDAFGITCCLYTYSNLSFDRNETLAQECARLFHSLREYSMEHEEVGAILRAID